MTQNILYLSYDGMTDPLGQSQVLPYIIGLSAQGYRFTLISFEKPDRFVQHQQTIQELCNTHHIDWQPKVYHKSPPVFSTIWDIYQMYQTAQALHQKKGFKALHCRGYISSLIGLWMKKKEHIPFIFDMRGFWADEKRDAGAWPQGHFLYDRIYNFFKQKEKDFIKNTDFVVSLTNAGSEFIKKEYYIKCEKIDVIPTCVDQKNFYLLSKDDIIAIKKELNIDFTTKVFLYSGALGTGNYNSDIIYKVYDRYKKIHKNTILLILSKDYIVDMSKSKEDRIIINASHKEVNKYLNIADVGFVFYGNGWSNIGRSPTKLGEYLYAGMKVLSFGEMGDVKVLSRDFPIYEIESLEDTVIDTKILELENNSLKKSEIVKLAFNYYSLDRGVMFYKKIYNLI